MPREGVCTAFADQQAVEEFQSEWNGATYSRRQWIRFRDDSVRIDVPTPRGYVRSIVLNESFGGIALLIPDGTGLEVHTPISVLYHQVPMKGVIRHLSPSHNGWYRMGIEWIRPMGG